jgi:hypothetical protein
MLIVLPQGSRFVSARAFPIRERGVLPFQTLYTEHDASPGSPRKNGHTTTIMSKNDLEAFESMWQNLNVSAPVFVQ